MDPKKGRRVRKLAVPTDGVPEFELVVTGAGEGSQREREGTATARAGGGGQDGGGQSRENTLVRGGSC